MDAQVETRTVDVLPSGLRLYPSEPTCVRPRSLGARGARSTFKKRMYWAVSVCRSPLLDLEIMARTLPAVVTKRGGI